ncbi:uncharacterized protein LOC144167673 [Haemaphysalis longicornis]
MLKLGGSTMEYVRVAVVVIVGVATYLPANAQKSRLLGKENEIFDPCEEKFKVVEMAKGARLGAKMLDICAMKLITRYGPRAINLQKAAVKICVAFRLCHAKYAEMKISDKAAFKETMPQCVVDMCVLTMKLNPQFIHSNMTAATAIFTEGAVCLKKNGVYSDELPVALVTIKWLRSTVF